MNNTGFIIKMYCVFPNSKLPFQRVRPEDSRTQLPTVFIADHSIVFRDQAVVGNSMEMDSVPPKAFAIRSRVATDGFATPLSILEISD